MKKPRRIFNAPLLWFLFAGAGLFFLDSRNDDNLERRIEVNAGDIQRLQHQFRAQTGGGASAAQLNELIDELILERRLASEARALGLDQEDVIIQRRLAQKLKFLTEDLADHLQPDDRTLQIYFEHHRDDYQGAGKLSFRQVFFSRKKRGKQTESDAMRILSELQQTPIVNWRAAGDPSIAGRSFADQPLSALAQRFGATFVERLSLRKSGSWQGPLQSELGLHLVIVDDYVSAPPEHWSEVREQVLYDYRQAQRARSFARYVETLERKYPAIVAVNLNADIGASAGAAK